MDHWVQIFCYRQRTSFVTKATCESQMQFSEFQTYCSIPSLGKLHRLSYPGLTGVSVGTVPCQDRILVLWVVIVSARCGVRPGLGVKEEGQPQTCKELLVPEKQFGSDCGPGGARGGILPTEGVSIHSTTPKHIILKSVKCFIADFMDLTIPEECMRMC
ncbi:hypothetical protein CB1_000318013 [Camelus ferus]|nr:hypothetical protein CB1_000318013 [Camelus ferus]